MRHAHQLCVITLLGLVLGIGVVACTSSGSPSNTGASEVQRSPSPPAATVAVPTATPASAASSPTPPSSATPTSASPLPGAAAPSTGSPQSPAASAGGVTLRILSPKPGDVLSGGTARVEYQVDGIRLVSPGGRNRIGQGHVHVYLNNEEKRGPWTTFNFTGLRPGSHSVTVEVQSNDHSSSTPPLEVSVTFAMQ
ncbi:MAG: hypothetical protein HW403_896 [Dehalococcoidia bacterium]|nr:hypothetical protein [Dehalococcoidia bacterium]